jgi:hypothetical protein
VGTQIKWRRFARLCDLVFEFEHKDQVARQRKPSQCKKMNPAHRIATEIAITKGERQDTRKVFAFLVMMAHIAYV